MENHNRYNRIVWIELLGMNERNLLLKGNGFRRFCHVSTYAIVRPDRWRTCEIRSGRTAAAELAIFTTRRVPPPSLAVSIHRTSVTATRSDERPSDTETRNRARVPRRQRRKESRIAMTSAGRQCVSNLNFVKSDINVRVKRGREGEEIFFLIMVEIIIRALIQSILQSILQSLRFFFPLPEDSFEKCSYNIIYTRFQVNSTYLLYNFCKGEIYLLWHLELAYKDYQMMKIFKFILFETFRKHECRMRL